MASINVNAGDNQQQQPSTTPQISDSLRSYSVLIKCPQCSKEGATTIALSWNIVTCLVAYFCSPCYCCWADYKRKDWNCYNAAHNCTSCNAYIDTYSSC